MITEEDKKRVELAVSCHDCDQLPRQHDAGRVVKGKEGEYQLMHNGIRTFTDTHYGLYNIEVIRRLRGHHEPQEEIVFHHVLEQIPDDGVMMELGSFWAYYSLWFLTKVKSGKAILVEPVPTALEAGRRNFQLNNRVGTFVNAAVGQTVAPEVSIELWPGKSVLVESTTVDELMLIQKISRLDLLHADIQGWEVSMLLGAAKALQRKAINWVFISTHGENIHQRCLQILRQFGYRIHVEHTPGESFTIDGLIVAGVHNKSLSVQISKHRTWRSTRARWRATIRVYILEKLGIKKVTA